MVLRKIRLQENDGAGAPILVPAPNKPITSEISRRFTTHGSEFFSAFLYALIRGTRT